MFVGFEKKTTKRYKTKRESYWITKITVTFRLIFGDKLLLLSYVVWLPVNVFGGDRQMYKSDELNKSTCSSNP